MQPVLLHLPCPHPTSVHERRGLARKHAQQASHPAPCNPHSIPQGTGALRPCPPTPNPHPRSRRPRRRHPATATCQCQSLPHRRCRRHNPRPLALHQHPPEPFPLSPPMDTRSAACHRHCTLEERAARAPRHRSTLPAVERVQIRDGAQVVHAILLQFDLGPDLKSVRHTIRHTNSPGFSSSGNARLVCLRASPEASELLRDRSWPRISQPRSRTGERLGMR